MFKTIGIDFFFINGTDLWEFRTDLNVFDEAYKEIDDAGPGVDAVRSVQNQHDVQLLPTLWNKDI